MVCIYIIELLQGKYYIGKTSCPQFRLESHFNSSGSDWTKLYKPIRVIEVKPNCDDFDEDKITIQYMDKYGINNVRGGSFVSVKLDKSTVDTIKIMINGSNNKCFICRKPGHFAKDCKDNNDYKSDTDESDTEQEYVWFCEYCGKEFLEENKCEYHQKYCNSKYKKQIIYENNNCFRCGREGHYASSCYASKHIKGYYLKY